MSGWISIHRCIQEHWLWKEKPFDKRSAWIDLLLLVNHEPNKVLIDGELVTVEAGQRITSIRQLADRWGWSRHKVDSFLNLLENDKMIAQKRDTKKTLITIENYAKYQSDEKRKEPRKSHERATKEPRSDTNNNDNNDNNDNKSKDIYSVLDNYTSNDDLRQALRDFLEMRKKIKAPLTDRAFNMLLKELDKLGSTDEMKIKLLEQSILNNWKSVYPLKQQQAKPQQSKPNKFHNFSQREHVPGELDAMAEKKREELMKKLKDKGEFK